KKAAAPPPSSIERGATQLISKGTILPSVPQAGASGSTAITDSVESALLRSISLADDDFQTLASNRAKAVREYVLQSGKVEGERVFLTEAKTGSLKTDGARVYLQLQ